MRESILIPEERTNVLRDRKVKESIENKLNVKLYFIDNTIEIDGEGLEMYQAKLIVKAIGRGFSPDNAFRLFDENTQLEIIELGDYSENKMKTIKARLIGAGGKIRKTIEQKSGCSVSVYGKTVAIIGTYEQMVIAHEAVNMILHGAKLTTVMGFLMKAGIHGK